MTVAAVVYVSIALVVALASALFAQDPGVSDESRKPAARVALLAPVWPLVVVWYVVLTIRDLWDLAK